MPVEIAASAPSDEALLDLVHQGDRGAAGELFQRYALHLRRFLLSARSTQPADADDLVQSAFRTFLSAADRGLYSVPEGADLEVLLITAVLNKWRSRARAAKAAKRSPGVMVRQDGDGTVRFDPASLVEARDLVEHLPPAERAVADLRIAGHSVEEIARILGRTRRAVERNLQSCRKRLLAQGVCRG